MGRVKILYEFLNIHHCKRKLGVCLQSHHWTLYLDLMHHVYLWTALDLWALKQSVSCTKYYVIIIALPVKPELLNSSGCLARSRACMDPSTGGLRDPMASCA